MPPPILVAAVAYLEPLTSPKLVRRSDSRGSDPVGVPLASCRPSSSTSTKEVNSGGHHTNFHAIRERNCTCATSRGGSRWQPLVQVDHDPPSPSSGSDAISIPGPSRFPTAMPATRSVPSFRLWLTSPSIHVASQWLESLKAWPVYPIPGRAWGRSLRPAAHSNFRLTSVQSPLRSSADSDPARSRAALIRPTAVPGYAGSTTTLAPALMVKRRGPTVRMRMQGVAGAQSRQPPDAMACGGQWAVSAALNSGLLVDSRPPRLLLVALGEGVRDRGTS
mmetsp:Transcript_4481/g.11429  ORF Transcript_4481/g.11429 Transcript_4481/m.11429 type:complete len:277 (+) Transcript_4481:193-1023(+)